MIIACASQNRIRPGRTQIALKGAATIRAKTFSGFSVERMNLYGPIEAELSVVHGTAMCTARGNCEPWCGLEREIVNVSSSGKAQRSTKNQRVRPGPLWSAGFPALPKADYMLPWWRDGSVTIIGFRGAGWRTGSQVESGTAWSRGLLIGGVFFPLSPQFSGLERIPVAAVTNGWWGASLQSRRRAKVSHDTVWPRFQVIAAEPAGQILTWAGSGGIKFPDSDILGGSSRTTIPSWKCRIFCRDNQMGYWGSDEALLL